MNLFNLFSKSKKRVYPPIFTTLFSRWQTLYSKFIIPIQGLFVFRKDGRVYLDYAAATPLSKEAFLAMKSYFSDKFSNPSSLHEEGTLAKTALKESREKVAGLLGSRPEEIIFTSGGTESNNLAIFGFFENLKQKGKNLVELHAITSEAEHSSVLGCFKKLEKEGLRVDHVGILPDGTLDIADFKKKLKKETVFVSIMLVNNEIGTIQPLKEINKILERFAKQNKLPKAVLHTDAVQAPLYLETNVQDLGVDMLSLDAAKLYGPKGAGLLFKRKGTEIKSIEEGGAQERGLRPGTPNVAAIAGIARALEIADKERENESARLVTLRSNFLKDLSSQFADIRLNGSLNNRIANNINIFIPGIESEFAVIKLDYLGFAVSSESACLLETPSGSYVVSALQKGGTEEGSTVRITMGRDTTKRDLQSLLKAIGKLRGGRQSPQR